MLSKCFDEPLVCPAKNLHLCREEKELPIELWPPVAFAMTKTNKDSLKNGLRGEKGH